MATSAREASVPPESSGTFRKSEKKHKHKSTKQSSSSSESSQHPPPEKKSSSASLMSAPFDATLKAALEAGDLLQTHVLVGYHHSFFKASEFLAFLIVQFDQGQKKVKEMVLSSLTMWCDLRFTQDLVNRKTRRGNKVFTQLLDFVARVEKLAPPSREFGPARTTAIKMAALRNYYCKYRPKTVGPKSQQSMSQETSPELLSELADQQAKREAGQFLSCFWWAHPMEVALKFFQIEFLLFRRIDTRELVNLSWRHSDAAQKCPNVLEMIARSNNVSFWVASKIVKTGDVEKRVMLIERCIELAEACERMHNFNSLMSILGGLNLHPVQRLKRTWERVSANHHRIMRSVEEFMESKGNYRNYRERVKLLRESDQCVLPYLGLYLRDLVFIDEGQDTRVHNSQLNRDKVQMTTALLMEFRDFQTRQMKEMPQKGTPEIDEIWEYYENMRGMNEAAVLKLSRILEPPRSHASSASASPVEPSHSNTSLDASQSSTSTFTNTDRTERAGGILTSLSGTLQVSTRQSSAGGGSEADDASSSESSHMTGQSGSSNASAMHTPSGLRQSRSNPSNLSAAPQGPQPLLSPKRGQVIPTNPSTGNGTGSRIGPPSPNTHRV